jgi:ceramide glucosyltransferase
VTTCLLLLFAASCAYQIFAVWCAFLFSQRTSGRLQKRLRFSQIKPVRYPEPRVLLAVREFFLSTRELDHDFYICSAETAPNEWLESCPGITWLCLPASQAQNGKAATLSLGERYWSGDIFIVSDADMSCTSGYLAAVLGEFSDPEVGVVTCLYRAQHDEPLTLGGLLESLCILDFSSSVLVAERVEGVSFAMGSTMAIRREVLEQIGGFAALESYLADDFQLGHRAAKKGWRVALAPTVVETRLGQPSLRQAMIHQYRWMVTSRVSRPGGHLAFIVTQGVFWAALLAVLNPAQGGTLMLGWSCLRIVTGCLQNLHLSEDGRRSRTWEHLLLPVKDGFFLILWLLSFKGRRVKWGEQEIEVDKDGRIIPAPQRVDGR